MKTQERDLMKAQEMAFKKDRQIREEAQKCEVLGASIADMRLEQEAELDRLRGQLAAEKLRGGEAAERHRRELDEIRREVADKIPQLLSSAIEKVLAPSLGLTW